MAKIYQPGQRIDHYEIIRLVARGVASHVYLAQDRQVLQQVILKFPLDDVIGGAAVFERYKREAALGKRLRHPGIQRHLNPAEQRSEEYMVLEYLPGRTLREVLEENAPALLPTTEVIRILLRVCAALVYVHEHGVIHRDVKPDNILLLNNGEVKLLDFGIAMLGGKRRLKWQNVSGLIGTPDYMAPELLWGKQGSVQTDIYAVGMTLYELCCGRTPFEEKDGFAFVTRHISHDPPGILAFNPTLSPALVTVIMRCIRRDPARRYISMQDLVYDLSHLDEVTPETYIPAPTRIGGRYRQVIRTALIILCVCAAIIACGVLAQYAHSLAH
jgi:eukaryotic-like serine/threonine-protein kinase